MHRQPSCTKCVAPGRFLVAAHPELQYAQQNRRGGLILGFSGLMIGLMERLSRPLKSLGKLPHMLKFFALL
jgi:hypothetical protein